MNIKKQLINNTPYKYGKNNKKNFITIHETANTSRGADAQAHANLQTNGNSRNASWHWQVDDKEAIQSFTHDFQLWHAGDGRGDGNLNSIGVEICVNSDGDFQKAVSNAQELVKRLMDEHNIIIDRVVPHKHWSGKNCPANLLNQWDSFIEGVSGKSTIKPSKPQKPQSKWNKVNGNWTGQTLKNGQYGEPVRQLQSMLANNNPPFYPEKGAKNNGVDSYYGDKTEDAVRRYQSYYGLTVDGLAGKKTYNSLYGNRGRSVSEMADMIINNSNAPNGHAARREWLGVDDSTYQKVRAEVNKRF